MIRALLVILACVAGTIAACVGILVLCFVLGVPLATMVVVVTPSAHAQEAHQITAPVSISVGDFGEYGYASPYLDLGAGIEARNHHSIFEASASYSPTHKNTVTNGYSFGGRVAASLRARPFFFGTGVSTATLHNSAWTKTATRPFVTIGMDTDTYRMSIEHTFTGHDPNALTGWSAHYRFNVARHVRIGASLYQSTFEQPIGSGHTQGAMAYEARIEYVFRGRR